MLYAVCFFYMEDGKALCVHRKPPKEHLVGLAGGKVDEGEDLEEAIIREVQEEVGWVIKPLFSHQHLTPIFTHMCGKDYLTTTFVSPYVNKNTGLEPETKIEFLSPKDLIEQSAFPAYNERFFRFLGLI